AFQFPMQDSDRFSTAERSKTTINSAECRLNRAELQARNRSSLPAQERLVSCREFGRSTVLQKGKSRLARKKTSTPRPRDPFADLYPNIARWVQDGWIELGRDDMRRSFIRVLDIGGLIWDGDDFPTVDAALQAADKAVGTWFAENG